MRLTLREFEVVQSLALGLTWAETMKRLGISRGTLQTHRARAFDKYDVGCMVDLYRALGWLDVPNGRDETARQDPAAARSYLDVA